MTHTGDLPLLLAPCVNRHGVDAVSAWHLPRDTGAGHKRQRESRNARADQVSFYTSNETCMQAAYALHTEITLIPRPLSSALILDIVDGR